MEKNISELNKLNKEQKEAVEFGKGPVLIVAGAGTGKTTVITSRILHLIETKKAKPEEILALTFTDKAAQEMEERVDKLLPFGYVDLWISTFHSFCERILKERGLEIGLSPDFRVLDPTGAWILINRNLSQFDLDYYRPLGNPSKFIRVLIEHFSRCKDDGIYPKEYLKYGDDLRLNLDEGAFGSKEIKSKDKKGLAQRQQEADRIKEVANAYSRFQKLLLDNNALDFGDLINYTLKLFKKRPAILEKYQRQFKYILVDEFQDTNWAQYELVKLLARPKNNLTICADDDQAIYRFRGASFNNVLQFRKDYPKAKEIVLINNYRSKQNILDLAYKFIQFNNPNRLEYQINQVAEISKKAKEKGVDLKNFKKINKKLKAAKEEPGIIKYLHYKTSGEELNGVINKIRELLNQDKKSCLNDFAILTRTNETANVFARAMDRAGIPYQFLASRGLYTKPIILDIIAYFKLLTNYYENSAVYRVLNLPCLNIPFEDLTKITQRSYQQGETIYETLGQISLIPGISGKAATEITFMLGLIQKQVAKIKEQSVSEIFVDFLKNSGYLDYLTIKKNEAVNRENLKLINLFYDKIKDFEESQIDPLLTNFVEQLDMELESGEQGSLKFDPESGPETIKIMTVHSAKGLEFKYVFLTSLADKRFPTIERKNQIEIPQALIKEVSPEGDIHLQEERRLFYVGMTRAKNGLFLTLADDYGGMRKKKPSRFLIECGIAETRGPSSVLQTRGPSSGFWQIPAKTFVKQDLSAKYNLPDHFSYTQLVAFEKCPLQYKFAHILKIPVKGRPNFSFGKTIHNALFQFINLFLKEAKIKQGNLFSNNANSKKNPIDFKELLKIYEQNWIDEWYENKKQKQEYYKLGKKILKSFYQDFSKTRPQIEFIQGEPALEQAFNLRIGGNALIGRIDRIDRLKDGNSEIIDYKTGSAKQSLSALNKQQLLIYQIAAEDILGLKPSKLTYYYLEQGKRVSFCGTEEDKEKLRQNLLKEIQEIKNSAFRPKPGWHCQYCDFKEICEYRRNN
jgi:DNA helicase-2/ATP-dependent DNA helicase PcrA